MNELCRRLHITVPILCAPTGSIAGPELAAAVSNARALGAMGLTWTDPATAAAWVRQVKASTAAPFQVNFALAFPPNALNAVFDAGAQVITFSWGDPAPYVAAVRNASAKLGIQVTSVPGVRRALEHTPDFLICQGVEAGGHVQSHASLWDLLPEIVVEAGEVPVAAAGGIAGAPAMARAFAAGAQGVVLGTRFVATQESRAHPDYKHALIAAAGSDTVLTTCFDIGWPQAPHRVLRNSTFGRWEAYGCPPSGSRPGESDIVAHSSTGAEILRYEDTGPQQGMTGDIAAMCLYAGTSVGDVQDLPSASDLVRRLWGEAKPLIQPR
jgi:NAD(P)H-dependent flavin oxidoreductase YrpB (nitropropane dioxygenase family)